MYSIPVSVLIALIANLHGSFSFNLVSPVSFNVYVAPFHGALIKEDPLLPIVALGALGISSAVVLHRLHAVPKPIRHKEYLAIKHAKFKRFPKFPPFPKLPGPPTHFPGFPGLPNKEPFGFPLPAGILGKEPFGFPGFPGLHGALPQTIILPPKLLPPHLSNELLLNSNKFLPHFGSRIV